MANRYVDTNVFIRAFIKDDVVRSTASIDLLRRINRGEENASTDHAVLSETVFVLHKSYRKTKFETHFLVTSILNMKGLDIPNREHFAEALDLFVGLNISFGDAYVAVQMRERGISEIYSWDAEFDRVPWLKRIEPL